MADRGNGRGQEKEQERRGGGPRGPGRHGARIERAEDVGGTLRRLLATFEPYRLVLGVVVFLVTVGTLLNLLAPFLM